MNKLNEYQKEAASFYLKNKSSMVVIARAGSGKTSFLLSLQKLPKSKKSLMVAYTNAAKDELIKRMPEIKNRVKTTYQLGFSALRNSVSGVEKVEAFKYHNILRELIVSDSFVSLCGQINTKPDRFMSTFGLNSLVSNLNLCLANLLFEKEEINNLVNRSYFFHPGLESWLISKAIDKGMKQVKNKGIVHFSDMVSYVFSPYNTENLDNLFTKYPIIFLDEAQDTSYAQKMVVKHSLLSGGQLVAVGDDRQAIYGFNGAEEDSLESIKNSFNATIFNMPICYRCSQPVLESVKPLVDDIVGTGKTGKHLIIDFNQGLNYIEYNSKDDTLICCRTNAPLLKLASFLLDKQIPFNFKTPKLGDTIKNKIKSYKEEIKFRELPNKIEIDLEEANQNDNSYLADTLECILMVLELGCPDNYGDTLKFVSKLFYKSASNIVLGSIHSFKGSEADTCIVWGSNRIPHHMAVTESQLRQEENLKYVAKTRAKTTLIEVELD